MTHSLLVSVFCPDKKGLVAAITGCLFDLGANLGDTTFAVLGGGAEFSSVVDAPDDLTADALRSHLEQLPEIENGEITVAPFTLDTRHGPSGETTHNITIEGGDQPGLVARLSEAFIQYDANIVHLSAEATSDSGYTLSLAVNIPAGNADNCLATVANTAEGLQLRCSSEAV